MIGQASAEIYSQPIAGGRNVDSILMPPLAPPGQKQEKDIVVPGSKPGVLYSFTPTNNFNEIARVDKKTQIKTEKSSVPLSNFLLSNVKSLTQVAFKNGFVTAKDLETPAIDPDGKKPYAFLKIENGQLVIPDYINTRQIQDLAILIYQKSVVIPQAEPSPAGEISRVPEVRLIEKITEELKNLQELKVDTGPKGEANDFQANQVLEGLNIACRKAIENNLKAESYTTSAVRKSDHKRRSVGKNIDPYRDKGQKKIDTLMDVIDSVKTEESDADFKQRLLLEKITLLSEGKSDKEIEKIQKKAKKNVNVEFQGMETTAQYDLLMAQAFDVVIPPDARLAMEKQEQAIMTERDYVKKADMQLKLQQQKQMWRMAILQHYNVERRIPGMELLAEDLKNRDIFTYDEEKTIARYKEKVGKRIHELDEKTKTTGGFAKIDLLAANAIKAEDRLSLLYRTREQSTIDSLRIKLKDLLSTKLAEGQSAEQLIDQSGYMKGFVGSVYTDSDRDLIRKTVVDAFKSSQSIRRKLEILSKKMKPTVDPDSLNFGTDASLGLKGMELLYRSGQFDKIAPNERYRGYKVVQDNEKNEHLQSTVKIKRMADESGSRLTQNKVESNISPVPVVKPENRTAEEQKRLDEQAVELEKILNLGGEVKNSADLLRILGEKKLLIMNPEGEEKGHPYELQLKTISLNSADQLNIVSHLYEHIPEGTTIQIESLNLTLPEGNDKTPTTFKNFNIINLALSGSSEKEQTGFITLEGSAVDYIEISKGNFVVSIDGAAPIRIDVKDDALIDLVASSDDALKNILTIDDANPKTIFKFEDKDNARVEVILGTDKVYSDVGGPGMFSKNKWERSQKADGENILVQDENGVYVLKPKSEVEAAPQPPTVEKQKSFRERLEAYTKESTAGVGAPSDARIKGENDSMESAQPVTPVDSQPSMNSDDENTPTSLRKRRTPQAPTPTSPPASAPATALVLGDSLIKKTMMEELSNRSVPVDERGLSILNKHMMSKIPLDNNDRGVLLKKLRMGLENDQDTVLNVRYALRYYEQAKANGIKIDQKVELRIEEIKNLISSRPVKVTKVEEAVELVKAVLEIQYPDSSSPTAQIYQVAATLDNNTPAWLNKPTPDVTENKASGIDDIGSSDIVDFADFYNAKKFNRKEFDSFFGESNVLKAAFEANDESLTNIANEVMKVYEESIKNENKQTEKNARSIALSLLEEIGETRKSWPKESGRQRALLEASIQLSVICANLPKATDRFAGLIQKIGDKAGFPSERSRFDNEDLVSALISKTFNTQIDVSVDEEMILHVFNKTDYGRHFLSKLLMRNDTGIFFKSYRDKLKTMGYRVDPKGASGSIELVKESDPNPQSTAARNDTGTEPINVRVAGDTAVLEYSDKGEAVAKTIEPPAQEIEASVNEEQDSQSKSSRSVLISLLRQDMPNWKKHRKKNLPPPPKMIRMRFQQKNNQNLVETVLHD